eukprot:3665156-Pyramimonas_sp.AAC.1
MFPERSLPDVGILPLAGTTSERVFSTLPPGLGIPASRLAGAVGDELLFALANRKAHAHAFRHLAARCFASKAARGAALTMRGGVAARLEDGV